MNEHTLRDEARKAGRPARSKALKWFALAACAFVLIAYNPLSSIAVRFNQESMAGGAAIYGTLRVLNSVMSVAKDADVQASAAVASVSFSPGQLLQPVTNTIDRIADLLFILIIGSGLVAALTTPLAKIGAALAFASALAIGGMKFVPVFRYAYAERLLRAVFIIGLLAGAVVPGAFASASILGDHITRSAWQNATSLFEGMKKQINDGTSDGSLAATEALTSEAQTEETQPAPASPDESVIGSTFSKIGSALSASKNAVTETAAAATSLATSVRDQAASNVKIVRDGVAFSGHLLDASVQIAVAYLAKLVFLPVMIFGVAIFLLRSASLPSFSGRSDQLEHV